MRFINMWKRLSDWLRSRLSRDVDINTAQGSVTVKEIRTSNFVVMYNGRKIHVSERDFKAAMPLFLPDRIDSVRVSGTTKSGLEFDETFETIEQAVEGLKKLT